MSKPEATKLPPLPREDPSPAALLSATHLFTVEVRSAAAPEWSHDLIDRKLRLELVLQAVYKGEVDGAPGRAVSLTVAQRNPLQGGYQGIWSHVQPEPTAGTLYLVVAEGASHDPAALLAEPALRQLVPGERVVDVRLAMQAEALWNATIAATREANAERPENRRVDPQQPAMTRLVELTREQRATGGRLYGDYLWARIGRPVYDAGMGAVDKLLEIVTAGDTGSGLRGALADELLGLAVSLGGEARVHVARALLLMLTVPGAAPLRGKLIDGSLPNLLLPEEGAPPAAETVLPDAPVRRSVREVLAGHDSDEARRLVRWLDAR